MDQRNFFITMYDNSFNLCLLDGMSTQITSKIFRYSHFVLLIFSQVLDNGLKCHLAINALFWEGSLTKQHLQYFVSLEKGKRRSRGGMVVPRDISTYREGDEEDSMLLTETSPLTMATNESKSTNTTNSPGCWRRKSTRKSPRQVSIARLHAKTKQDAEGRGNGSQRLSRRQQQYWQLIPSAEVRQPMKQFFD